MMGKGSVNHNTRTFKAKNVDSERSQYNVQYCHTNIKTVYHQLFDEALGRYNAKQNRNDRKIDNYYEKIRQGKQEKLFHEVIFQIGNKDDMNARSAEGEKAREILSEFMRMFQGRNPNLHVFSAHLHMDEETPHLHIDFIPFTRGGTRGATEWNQWIDSEKQALAKVMERYGVQWKQLGTNNKHLSVLDFEKRERQKEVAELALTSDMLKAKTETLSDDKDKLLSDNQQLKQQQNKLQRQVERMADSKTTIERSIHAYDEDEKWQLPEPGLFMNANSFREKKALPLVNKLKQVIKNLLVKCINLVDEINRLKSKVRQQDEKIGYLSDRVMTQRDTIKELQGKSADLERVECYMGREKVQTMISHVKELEQIEKAKKLAKKRSLGLSR